MATGDRLWSLAPWDHNAGGLMPGAIRNLGAPGRRLSKVRTRLPVC